MRKNLPKIVERNQPECPLTLLTDGLSVEKPASGVLVVRADADGIASLGGSENQHFNRVMLIETMATTAIRSDETDADVSRAMAVMAALKAFKPRDEIEGMLAAQTTALHFGAMECFRRAMLPGQPIDVTSKLRRDGAHLARGMTDMLDALDRKRGKGPQVVRVERVVVHEGGQAIVGSVTAGIARGKSRRPIGGTSLSAAFLTGGSRYSWHKPARGAARGPEPGRNAKGQLCRTAGAECMAAKARDRARPRGWNGCAAQTPGMAATLRIPRC